MASRPLKIQSARSAPGLGRAELADMILDIVGAVLGVAVLGYLMCALIRPDWF